jgi:Domain of unknown function (DUF4034)
MGLGDDGRGRSSEAPVVRPWLWVALAAVVFSAGAVLARAAIHYYFVHRPPLFANRGAEAHQKAALEREARVKPAAFVALAPLPTQLPLVERPGKDAYGYPHSYVDRAALRSLLGRGKYQELTTYIEQFQADADADFHDEYFIHDAVDAFETSERALDANLDAWVTATPNSFAPYAARGAHRFAFGYAQRGNDYASETDADNFKGMEAAFALAFDDFEHALRLSARLMPARRYEIRIAFAGSQQRKDLDAMCKRAFEVCPACFQPRVTQQIALEPRWHGNYEQMAAAAKAAKRSLNPRFQQLPGYELLDRAHVLATAKDYKGAITLVQRAVALGPSADFLEDLARDLTRDNDAVGSLKAISEALELRPQLSDLLFYRAYLYTRTETRNYEAAYADMLLGLRLAPADEDGKSSLRYVAQGLGFMAGQAEQRGDLNNAIRLLDESMDLYPNQQVEQRRNAVLTSGFHGTPEELAALEAAANAAPNDFYAHERFDYALSRSAQWDRIVLMWTAFIAHNPGEGRAYYERAGTYSHMAQGAAAQADSVRACELGVSVACARAAL